MSRGATDTATKNRCIKRIATSLTTSVDHRPLVPGEQLIGQRLLLRAQPARGLTPSESVKRVRLSQSDFTRTRSRFHSLPTKALHQLGAWGAKGASTPMKEYVTML